MGRTGEEPSTQYTQGFLIDNKNLCVCCLQRNLKSRNMKRNIFVYLNTSLLSDRLACAFYTVSGMHQSVFETVCCPHSSGQWHSNDKVGWKAHLSIPKAALKNPFSLYILILRNTAEIQNLQ